MNAKFLVIASLTIILALFGSGQAQPAAGQTPATSQSNLSQPAVPDRLVFTVKVPALQLAQEGDAPQPGLDGYVAAGAPGDPALPVKAYQIALPPDVIPESVKAEVIAAPTADLDGDYTVAPAPPAVTRVDEQEIVDWGENAASIVAGKNTQVYQNDAYFPQSPLSGARFDQMRKWRFVTLQLTPLQYNPVTGKLRLASEVQVLVSFERAAPADPRQRQIELSDTVMDERAAEMFANYDQARDWYPATPRPAGLAAASNYVIVTTKSTVAASKVLNSFIAHKQAQGYSVLVATEDQYGGPWEPRIRAQKIRQWLADNYLARSIQYVLLIGKPTPFNQAYILNLGVGDIPMRMCWPMRRYLDANGKPRGENIPTDMLYADLTGNWDLNTQGGTDDYCGELGDDNGLGGMNFFPEVYVGRIPVYPQEWDWAATLDSILQKTIIYEDSGSMGWRKQALLPMSFSDKKTDGAYLAERMKSDFLNAAGYSSYTLYQHTQPGCGSALDGSQNLAAGAVPDYWKNHDVGLVTWWAHGSYVDAGIGYENCSAGPLFSSWDAPLLDDSHPASVFTASCNNGFPEISYNLGYALLKQGAVATVTASRLSTYREDIFTPNRGLAANVDLAYYFTQRAANGEKVGYALYQEKYEQSTLASLTYASTTNWLDFNLYGDPTLSINDGNPTPPKAPSFLIAAAAPMGGINLSWIDESDNELGFWLSRASNSAGPWSLYKPLGVNKTYWSDELLSCGAHYYYRLNAYNDYGDSSSSNTADAWVWNLDEYEYDGAAASAKTIDVEQAYSSAIGQTHTFHAAGDVDWVKFTAIQGQSYDFSTSGLGANADTVLSLYDTNGATLLLTNDDCTIGSRTSCLNHWVAQKAGVFYLKVAHAQGLGGCTGYEYNLSVRNSAWGATNTPSQPSGLTATPVSNCQVDLNWTPGAYGQPATGFEIQRFGSFSYGGGAAIPMWQKIATVGAGVTHYSDSGLECNTSYPYRVLAFNFYGESLYSNTANGLTASADAFETDNSAAAAKSITTNGGLQAHTFHAAGDEDWVKFSASASQAYTITTSSLGANNDTYLELYSTDGVTLLESNDDCNGGWASCIKKWIPPANGVYYVRARHYGGAGGCPGYQYNLSVTRSDLLKTMPKPGGLYFSDTSVSSLQLAWFDEIVGPVAYRVERRQTITGTLGLWQVLGFAGPASSSLQAGGGPAAPDLNTFNYRDRELACNTSYAYRVRAFDDLGESAYSDVITGTTQITDGYEPDNDAPSARPIAVNNPQEHNLGAGLDNDWVYFTATAGEVYTITTSQFTHRDAQTPAMTLYSTNGTRPQATAAECSDMPRALCINGWTAPASDTYQVQVSGQGGCPGHDYRLNIIDGHLGELLPAPPTAFTGTLTASDTIALHWTDSSTNETGFRLERRVGDGWLQIADLVSGVTQTSDPGLACGLPYQYRVYAYNANGKSAYVTVDPITTPACVYHWPGENYLPLVVRK